MTGAGHTRATPGAPGEGGGVTEEGGSDTGGGERGAGATGAAAVARGRDSTRYRVTRGAGPDTRAMVRRADTRGTGSGPSQRPRGSGDTGAGQRTRGRWRAGGRGSGGP